MANRNDDDVVDDGDDICVEDKVQKKNNKINGITCKLLHQNNNETKQNYQKYYFMKFGHLNIWNLGYGQDPKIEYGHILTFD